MQPFQFLIPCNIHSVFHFVLCFVAGVIFLFAAVVVAVDVSFIHFAGSVSLSRLAPVSHKNRINKTN